MKNKKFLCVFPLLKDTTFLTDNQHFPSFYRAISFLIVPLRYVTLRKRHTHLWPVVSLYCHRIGTIPDASKVLYLKPARYYILQPQGIISVR